MNNCHSYRQYLSLVLGQRQRQRPAQEWPVPSAKKKPYRAWTRKA
ncbi:MAG: hypothetical protein ACK55I_27255 [bacterium]|jgi:hypothetical protein